ncbi:penicillin-binding protein [Pseudogracilibacillus auburnensis]|uniref:serine-type D-Ala-D-Ala carboxypeptidase n=1 Tax=Pseudogracilibacillus auburnensis TaxID=1494959 RepID=A0A2V3W2E4_9BACI|nr:penicillin-binding protein [Pseudogracilibacillus auburnensis]PXW88513.1 penicillin-binding protein 2B [Pseudogracilibacillus auburnensis]
MKKNKKTNIIASFLMIIFLALFLVLSGRFIYIQATGETNDVSLIEWANEKRETTIVLHAERGEIYDHNGMTLAYNRPTYRVYAILNPEYSKNQKSPKHVIDVEDTAEKLAPLIKMKPKEILDVLEKGIEQEKFQVEFGRNGKNLSQQKMEEIKDLQLPGINFIEDSIRYYPNGMFASHILGFARNDEDTEEQIGISGIEKERNELLSGTDGYIQYQRDKYDKKLLNPNEVIQKPEDGNNIYLTTDQKIQTLLEDVLSQVDDKYEPERITAVVMNPKTGEIIAMSNRPSFNPNNPDNVENWYNDVISTPFEPGSTAKIFTWAAAIEEGVYKGDEYFQSGKYVVNKKIDPINDHNKGAGWGSITYDEGFRRSSNVAASKLVWEKLGTDTYLDYLIEFGFDEKTDIDLPNEVSGQISFDWPSDKLRTAFGQSSTVTPIQQLKAASAIANNGKMVQPYVIKKIENSADGSVIEENEPKIVGEPISEDTAKQMIELLDSVVNGENGTGKPYRLDDYSVIGKTGTAQIPNPKGGGYMQGRENNVFSFLGMAPKDDPQLMMHVSVKQPKLKSTESGSTPVAFIFKNVMENGLHYLNIEPDKEKSIQQIETIQFPAIIDKDIASTEKLLKEIGTDYTVIGKGKKVVSANIEEGSTISSNQRIIVLTDKPEMPNVKGWSGRDILSLADMLEIEVEVKGNGFVKKQSIKEGTKLDKNMKLSVELTSTP